MPKLSVIGTVNRVAHLPPFGGTHHVSADEDLASVSGPTWAGGTVVLPGPVSSPNDLPSDGDYYGVADPRGLVTGNSPLNVDGGGYPIQGAPTMVFTSPFSEATFTFDDIAQAWIACVCVAPPPVNTVQ